MATLSTGQLTLADWAKRLDPDGSVSAVAELLSQQNDILEDAVFQEGNLPTGHRVTVRTGLPTVYWRALNAGVPTSKSTSAQVDESCGMLEARSYIDKKLAMLNGNTPAFRLSEDRAFLEAMNQAQANGMFYGNPATDPKQYLGLQYRYSSLTAGNAQNMITAGGAGSDNASVYLVVWSPETVFCTFPKGSRAGLSHQDLGEEAVRDASNNEYQALRTLYQWDNGLVVKDWRYVVRIPNIDVSDWLGVTGTQATSAATNLIKLMSRAIDRIPNLAAGRPAFYAPRTVYSGLRLQALERSQQVLSIEDALTQFGTSRKETQFLGIPLRMCDQLGIAETVVS
jgi:hypothetical protein